jgi:hypothetical protein
MRLSIVKKAALLGLALLTLVAIPALPAMAIEYGSGTYGECQYGSCSISISSNGTVAVNVTPASGGSCTIQKDVVSVFTDNSAGYNLTLANSSTNTALLKGGSSIASTTATQTSPLALTTNTWGYRVDSVGGFGAGPTSAQTNIAIGSTVFAGVPASSGTANTVANTAVPADPAVTTNVWYGVCANTSVASGIYTTQVTYTAVTN